MPPAQNNWAAQVRALDVYGGAIANMADLRRAQHISEAALALCREHNLKPEMVGYCIRWVTTHASVVM